MEPTTVRCASCAKEFVPRLSFQTCDEGGVRRYYCSQVCRHPALRGEAVRCQICAQPFVPTLAFQMVDGPEGRRFFCSEACRAVGLPAAAPPAKARVIAVLNQKGGTAKTTTAVSVAAGFAQLGQRVLLVDLDPQGNVGVALGLTAARLTHHLMLGQVTARGCIVPARERLDVMLSDQGLAAAEIALARADGRERCLVLSRAMAELDGYDVVILDCAPALSLINQNALVYAGEVLIPVSCDYLALVGVRQVMRTLQRLGEQLDCTIRVAGVLPTFYDARNRLSADVVSCLRKSFGARTLPPVRRNVKLTEAPSHKKTIFEHAPDSHGARDYIRVVEWLRTGAVADEQTRAA